MGDRRLAGAVISTTPSDLDRLVGAAVSLRDECETTAAELGPPVSHVYCPLSYAWPVHEAYIRRFGHGPKRALLVGMNPGPWGMAQTGVPFGDPHAVATWMGLSGQVGQPERRHPKRPVLGFRSRRREISGSRLYTMAMESYGGMEEFFRTFFVVNYCPLAFFDENGRNLTPPQLRASDRQRVFGPCDAHLRRVQAILRTDTVIGVGVFAEGRVRAALDGAAVTFGNVLHPSPASPRANRGWAEQALAELALLGLGP